MSETIEQKKDIASAIANVKESFKKNTPLIDLVTEWLKIDVNETVKLMYLKTVTGQDVDTETGEITDKNIAIFSDENGKSWAISNVQIINAMKLANTGDMVTITSNGYQDIPNSDKKLSLFSVVLLG